MSSSAFEFLMVLFLLWHARRNFLLSGKADVCLKGRCSKNSVHSTIIYNYQGWMTFVLVNRQGNGKWVLSPRAGEGTLISCWFLHLFFIQVPSQHWYQSLLGLRGLQLTQESCCVRGNQKVFLRGDSSEFVNCFEILGKFLVYALISLK